MTDSSDSQPPSVRCALLGCAAMFSVQALGFGALLLWVFLGESFLFGESFALGTTIQASFFPVVLGGIVGVVGVNVFSFGRSDGRKMTTVGVVALLFAGACLSGIFTLTALPEPSLEVEKELAPDGGIVGPVPIDKAGMLVEVRLLQSIEAPADENIFQRWSFVTVELLDNEKTYLSSFGGGFWHYAGYGMESGDGNTWGDYWEEEDTSYETMLRISSAGRYYLRIRTEANVSTDALSHVQLTMEERAWWGDPIPLRNAMLVALFFASALLVAPALRDYDD